MIGRDLARMPRCFKVGTDGSVSVGSVSHDVCNSSGEGFDRAGTQTSAVMVNALTSLTILLVGDTQSGMCCR